MFSNFVNKDNGSLSEEFQKYFVDPGPDFVVCDEGHMLKNDSTNIRKATEKIRTRRRVLLTGTPVENKLEECFNLISFVQPELLGSGKDFSEK